MFNSISIVPDRLAHYRVPVFNNISRTCAISELAIYADVREDSSGIKTPSHKELENSSFKYVNSLDVRVGGRLILSTGSIKAALSSSDVLILWGDAFCPGNWLSVFLAKLKGKKIAFWTHGLYGNEGSLKKWVRCKFYSMSDALLLYGSHARKLLQDSGFPEGKLYVINNALDFSVQDELFKKLRDVVPVASSEKLRLIFVGRLTKVKKLHLLLKALKELQSIIDVSLDLVGDGIELDNLKTIANDIGISGRVNFHGAVYEEAMLAELIMSADITVSPGNVGLTAMHSLVYGVPVVSHSNASTQMPEFESIQPGVSGELFDENDLNSLVKNILKCKSKISDNIITSESCRQVLKNFYSFSYQTDVFDKFLKKGLMFNEAK